MAYMIFLCYLSVASASLLFGFSFLNFTFERNSDYSEYLGSGAYTKAVPTSIQVSSNKDYYLAVPRLDPRIPATFAKLLGEYSEVLLDPFPDWGTNNLSNPDGFGSITAFEIDLKNNFWLVDNLKKCLINLNEEGKTIKKYLFSEASSNDTNIVDLALDLDRGFAYLSDMGQQGLIVLDLAKETSRLALQNHSSMLPDPSFWITVNGSRVFNSSVLSQGVGGIALSCDKRDLYYSPVTSRNLYAISTRYLRNEVNDTEEKVVDLGFKNTASKGIIISEKGNMYLSDLQEGNVYFYEQMMPYSEYFLVYFLTHVMNEENVIWPYHITFNNDKRSILVLANQYQNFLSGDVNFDNPAHGQFNFWVFETFVNDRTYLFRCQDVVSVHSKIEIPTWIYSLISILSIILVTLMICAYKHYRMLKKRHLSLLYN